MEMVVDQEGNEENVTCLYPWVPIHIVSVVKIKNHHNNNNCRVPLEQGIELCMCVYISL